MRQRYTDDTRDRRSALERLETCARWRARTREKRSDNGRSGNVCCSQRVYTCVHAPAGFARVCDSVAVAMALRTPTSQPLRIHTACVPPVLYVHRSVESDKDARSMKRERDGRREREPDRERERERDRESAVGTKEKEEARARSGMAEGNGEGEEEEGECRERV